LVAFACAPLLALFCVSCATVHEVTVDAIRATAPGAATSYRLEVERGGGAPLAPDTLERVTTHVREALAGTGAYEAPPGTAPDEIIRITAGVGPGHRKIVYEATVEPQYRVSRKDRKQIIAREKFIRLSARETRPASGGAHVPGEERWSVNVSIDDEGETLEPYLGALSTALRDHIGLQATEEKTVLVKESPRSPPPPAGKFAARW
jgi:hypothetical protein